MLSLIVCSRSKTISPELVSNINLTIGVEFEIIEIDNSNRNLSIFQAYNKGVLKARYPILCFLHDDILFHTVGWGERVANHFVDSNIGLIGIAGSRFIPNAPFAWNSFRYAAVYNWLQNVSDENGNMQREHWKNENIESFENPTEVVVVDGVWFCVRKSLFNQISFDESLFNNFHCYDLDISLQIRKIGFKVVVATDILLEHRSLGIHNGIWFQETEKLYDKWKTVLPQKVKMFDMLSDDELACLNHLAWDNFQKEKSIYALRHSKAYKIGKRIISILCFYK